ncbi:serine protease [Aliidongia dinghuensis]|uniref:Probable periplasmic serine endoprotease DegP-like n=1 Tax=Aliidongia dinghuensis TaxID=1867774 RepID=A0A8J2Z205_9PROT|nr:DegQ family serine endoprotease [Aliidongia dinghuensis]GGF48544.1 serine protease [Aliidongia dinghuensis]
MASAKADDRSPTLAAPLVIPGLGPLANRLLPAVVNVSTSQTIKPDAKRRPDDDQPQVPPGSPFEEFFKDFMDRQGGGSGDGEAKPQKAQSLGSGFVIDPAGYVVTNNHVIDGADEITVILQDNTNLKAELVGRDATTDLALLRVKPDHPLPAVPWGDSDTAKVGDWVMAIGNPFGLGGTVTSGIISARARAINDNGPYDEFLQTDASINRGNSGGPLFNTSGEVIGINSAIFSPSGGSIGIGFAIPSDLAKNVIAQLKATGKARRGWIGARIQTVNDDVATALGLDSTKGALVGGFIDKSPAKEAGIQPGDVLLQFDGRDVTNSRRLSRLVADAPVDKAVPVKLWRKGEIKTITVKVGQAEEAAEQTASLGEGGSGISPSTPLVKALGLSITEATPDLKDKFKLDDSANVVVVDVAKGSPAADKDLHAGDVILEVAQEEVKSAQDVVHKIDEAKKAGRKSILLLVDHGGDLRFVALRIDQG